MTTKERSKRAQRIETLTSVVEDRAKRIVHLERDLDALKSQQINTKIMLEQELSKIR